MNPANNQIMYTPKRPVSNKNPYQSRKSLPSEQDILKFMQKNKPRLSQTDIKLNPWNFPTIERNDEDVPLPKGFSAYAKAKRAEYVEKNLPKAEKYYRIAIKNKERLESSLKDLATVLHQQGKTEEACQFLEDNRYLCAKHISKLDNLISNLKKQVQPSGNFFNRTLVLFDFPEGFDNEKLKALFKNSTRIIQIEFTFIDDLVKLLSVFEGEEADRPQIKEMKACFVNFSSNSGARKTLETLTEQEVYQFYWVNTENKVVSKAIPYKKPKRNSVLDTEVNSPGIQLDLVHKEESKEDEFSAPTEETTTDMSNSSPLRRQSMSSNFSGWRSFVFPVLTADSSEGSQSDSSENSFCDEENGTEIPDHPLWKEVLEKETEVMNKIKEDQNYVNKILVGFDVSKEI